ncbi:hypothetical protein TNCV_3618461 [Trichonephila clavipes]|nr:hypothetical protein TNCV_3618461 [Trichonephila clavipes]
MVKAGSSRFPGRLQTRFRLSSRHSWEWDSLPINKRPQSAGFQPDRTKHHYPDSPGAIEVCKFHPRSVTLIPHCPVHYKHLQYPMSE